MTPHSEGMLRQAHRVHSHGRPVGERTVRPVGPIGQELNVANAQIRTLLDRQM